MKKTFTLLGFSKLLICVFALTGFVSTVNAQVTVTVTLNCNQQAGTLASGSVSSTGTINAGNMVTINSSANRGWAKFDLSFLPTGATINSATALFTTYSSTLSSATNSVFGFTGDPAGMTGAALYAACGSGTVYNSSSWTANALQTKALNAAGVAFLQANIGNQNVNLGYVRGSTNTYNIYGYPGRSANNQPRLQITYTIPSAIPSSATTLSASNILVSSATLKGGITVGSTLPNSVTYTGILLSTFPGATVGGFGVVDSTTIPLVNSGTISFNFTGLSLGTTYYYRAYVMDTVSGTANIAYGADSFFTTPSSAPAPIVQHTTPSNIFANSCNVGGTIVSNGGIPILSSGIVYSLTNNPVQFGFGVVDSTTNPVVTSGSFSFNLVGLSASTKYYYKSYASNSTGISYSALDSFTTAPIVAAFPYSENFDATGVNTGWTTSIVSGSVNNWVLGTPAKTLLNAPNSAPNSWVTKLSGSYDNSHDAAVVSPQFDFTTLTAAPVLRFKHKFVTEVGWDALIVEMSINGGAWTKLDNVLGTGVNYNTTSSQLWYNSSSTSGPIAPPKFSSLNATQGSNLIYATHTAGWITSVTPLVGAQGQSNVKFRFRFGSDGGGVDEGWALDDIEVFAPTAPNVRTGSVSNLTTTGCQISASIVDNGGNTITASGIVISTSPTPTRGSFGVIDSATNPTILSGSFNLNIAGLFPSTTYYYRTYAVNGVGTSYGPDSIFITNAAATAPSINKVSPSNIQAYSATVGGTIVTDGGAPVTASGIVYSTFINPSQGGFGVVDSATNPVVTSGGYSITPVGLTPATKYYYRAYATNFVGTTYSSQDSFTTAPVVGYFPYAQNFDTIGLNTGWTSGAVTSTLNDWIVGAPTKTSITAAFSAPNAWVTKLSGNYSTSHDAALVSPQFDFTSLVANPILRFKHKFLTESCCDGGLLEISLNGGLTWTKVENIVGTGSNFNTTNGTAWYNSGAQGNTWGDLSTAFSTNVNGWITTVIALPGTAGQSNVKIRFRFITDTSVENDGWAIDDIEVFAPTVPSLSTGTHTNVTTTNVTLFGNITNNGGNNVTASGIVLGTSPSPTRGVFGITDSATNPLVTGGQFNINFTGLFPSTTYYYRAYAVNNVGISYGPDSIFVTNSSAVVPTVLKVASSAVTAFGATVGGNITSDGGSAVYASGVVYSTSPNPAVGGFGVIDSTTSPAVISGIFTVKPVGLTHSTKYYYRAYATNNVGTAYAQEDSFTTAPVVNTLPYNQGFESGAQGWANQANGGGDNWVLGTPAKTYLTGAHTGSIAWTTKTSGDYDDNLNSSIVSPQFDFTSYAQDPVLRFYHKFRCENGWDGMIVEISVNGGAWSKLNPVVGTGANFNTLASYAWYNSTSTSGPIAPPKFSTSTGSTVYSSNNLGWIESATRLTGAAGQSNVRFRFTFGSDGSGTDEGWAIDDITVEDIVIPTVAASNVTLTPSDVSANVTFSSGNGQGRLVVARLTTTPAVAPYDTVLYTANATFGSGTLTGTGNYVVYSGIGSSVNVTGLTIFTDYTFDVYEFNGKYMHNKFTTAATNFTTTTPVKLLNFVAVKKSEDGVLSWVTASEVNNKGFAIERSLDGKTFEQVDFVTGKGNSNVKVSYSYTDAGVFAKGLSKVYYRLKQVDNDGKYSYSSIVMLANELNNGTEISAYPNPFSSDVTVSVNTAKAGSAKVEVYDISGRKVLATNYEVVEGSNALSVTQLSELQTGIYFVKVQVEGQEKVIKLVKN